MKKNWECKSKLDIFIWKRFMSYFGHGAPGSLLIMHGNGIIRHTVNISNTQATCMSKRVDILWNNIFGTYFNRYKKTVEYLFNPKATLAKNVAQDSFTFIVHFILCLEYVLNILYSLAYNRDN